MAKEKVTHLYLDDIRACPDDRWTVVKWPDEAIEIIKQGYVSHLSLDHDLGDDSRGTGYDVLLWLEEQVAMEGFSPPRVILVHSANTSAKQKMLQAVESIRRLHEQNQRM